MRSYKVVAAFIPAETETKPFNDFLTYTMPAVDAVMVRLDWNQIETAQGIYDFSVLDQAVNDWHARNKKIALVLSLVSDAVVGGLPNTSTPAYVLAQSSIVKCPFNQNGVPVAYDPNFSGPAQNFIKALLSHLESEVARSVIEYARIG